MLATTLLLSAVFPQDLDNVPPLAEAARVRGDWLVTDIARRAGIYRTGDGKGLALDNGLIRRTWRLAPNAATVALDNLVTGASLLRSVRAEAAVVVDGNKLAVGGLLGQRVHAYLRDDWLDGLQNDREALQLASWRVGDTAAPFEWRRVRHAVDRPWPPPGKQLVLEFRKGDLAVSVHHELYDGVPVLCKWMTVRNTGKQPVTVERFITEILAVVDAETRVESTVGMRTPDITVLSDYAFSGGTIGSSNQIASWVPDPAYSTQVNYKRLAPNLLVCRPAIGPDVVLPPGEVLTTFRTYLVIHDSTDRERQGLTIRRAWRTIAPWVTENPIMMHVRSSKPEAVRLAIDQCAAVGFEMVILTFGSGFSIEREDPEYIAQWKAMVDYARERGVELGGYSLLSSRRIGPKHDVIDQATGQPGGAKFGDAPCLCSEWGRDYFRKLYAFFDKTGFRLLEHDGSYPGDTCASKTHPGHRGHADSQWRQWETIRDFYRWCRGKGIYLNVPDFYFLAGSNKAAMGYRETNWSLPRAQQIMHGRQNIFDGTWEKTPTMGWMFVPLTEYHGGGAAATIEPLHEHRDAYAAHLANNLGMGVQACYRGPRLFDTPATKLVVAEWVAFFKRHRAILESDLLHLRRADGRDIDYALHVNPRLEEKGLLMVYNPLDREVRKTIEVPLYYTGLTQVARIRGRDGAEAEYRLDRRYRVELPVVVPARGRTWFMIR